MFLPIIVPCALLAALALALTFGGPRWPRPLPGIVEPFAAVDFSDLPALSGYRASDGVELGYRLYAGGTGGSIVLVHGSSADSVSLHRLARAVAGAGFRVYALDIRGHGASGRRGHLDRIGRLETDLADFVRLVQPPRPCTLVGFSSGGGFVLRVAASAAQNAFDRYLMLAPFIGEHAPNQRAGSGGWVGVGFPRIVALLLLNALGVRRANALPVIRFALDAEMRSRATSQYDFNLASNFRPPRDYAKAIRRVHQPCAIVAGADDELFDNAQLAGIVRASGQNWPIRLLPGVGHIALTVEPGAIKAVVQALNGDFLG